MRNPGCVIRCRFIFSGKNDEPTPDFHAEIYRWFGENLQRPEIRLETRRFLGRRPEFLAVFRVVENLHRVREPSLRHYVRAKELKAAGMDWTEVLATEEENPRAQLAAKLLARSLSENSSPKSTSPCH